MKPRTREFFFKAGHAMSANVISLVVSVVTTLLVPKALGVEEFGHFQLYIFYSSYVGLLHLGWNDGILLRYGGTRYQDLDREILFSQFWMLVLQQLLVAAAVVLVSGMLSADNDVLFVFRAIALCTLLTCPQYMLIYVLQASARIKEYAQIVVVQRVAYVALVVLTLVLGQSSYQPLVEADLVSRFGGLLLAAFLCRDVVFQSLAKFRFAFEEASISIRAGAPLMLGGVAGLLVVGVVRLGIAGGWDVATFGMVSLSLSLANMALTTIVSAGTVAFPLLRRLPRERLPGIYHHGRQLLTAISLAMLLLYYPFRLFIASWLPDYLESATYLGLLFPVFVYEARNALLLETYLKVLRMERVILKVNVLALLLSVFVTVLTTSVLSNLDLAVLSIPLVAAVRCVALEWALSEPLGVRHVNELIFEAALVLLFVITASYCTQPVAVAAYLFAFGGYLVLHRRQIGSAVSYLT